MGRWESCKAANKKEERMGLVRRLGEESGGRGTRGRNGVLLRVAWGWRGCGAGRLWSA